MDVTVSTMLPKLQNDKLQHVGRNSKRNRRIALMNNENANEFLKKYDYQIDKEKQLTAHKMTRNKIPVVKKMVRVRGMQRCLARRRKEAREKGERRNTLGKYNGLPLTALRYEIDSVIRDSNPRLRRLRKTQKLLNEGKDDGRLINQGLTIEKFSEIINRPFPELKSKSSYLGTPSDFVDGDKVKVHCISITDPRRYVLQPLPVPKEVSRKNAKYSKDAFMQFPSIASLKLE